MNYGYRLKGMLNNAIVIFTHISYIQYTLCQGHSNDTVTVSINVNVE